MLRLERVDVSNNSCRVQCRTNGVLVSFLHVDYSLQSTGHRKELALPCCSGQTVTRHLKVAGVQLDAHERPPQPQTGQPRSLWAVSAGTGLTQRLALAPRPHVPLEQAALTGGAFADHSSKLRAPGLQAGTCQRARVRCARLTATRPVHGG
jgi:hypothetical protein